jgi:ferredoxin
MQIAVDRKRCEGHGVCTGIAPHLFRHNEAGVLILTYDGTDIPESDIDDAEFAVTCCPVQALYQSAIQPGD